MMIRRSFSVALAAVVVAGAALASPAVAQVPSPPLSVNYTFDLPMAKVTPNPCTNGFTLVTGSVELAIAATSSPGGFELGVGIASSGSGIDVSADGAPLVTGTVLPPYVYASDFGAVTTFPEGVPEYFERTLNASDFLARESPTPTGDSYTMNTTLRLVFTNGVPSVPLIESVSVACQ